MQCFGSRGANAYLPSSSSAAACTFTFIYLHIFVHSKCFIFRSVAGNPLICGSKRSSNDICSSPNLSPLSFSLDSSPGNSSFFSFIYYVILRDHFWGLILWVNCFISFYLFMLGKHNSKKLAIALGVSLSGAFLILIVLGLLWHRKRKRSLIILNVGG